MFYRKPLTYSFDALEPYIDERTMREHYEVHYKKYEDTLNEAIKENKNSQFLSTILIIFYNFVVLNFLQTEMSSRLFEKIKSQNNFKIKMISLILI